MAEVLEIQIQDKGPRDAGAPPRPPRLPATAASPEASAPRGRAEMPQLAPAPAPPPLALDVHPAWVERLEEVLARLPVAPALPAPATPAAPVMGPPEPPRALAYWQLPSTPPGAASAPPAPAAAVTSAPLPPRGVPTGAAPAALTPTSAAMPSAPAAPAASVADVLPFMPAILGLLNAQLGQLETVADMLGAGHAPGAGQGGPKGPGGAKKPPTGPSVVGGLAKLGVSQPAQIVQQGARMGEGASELGAALGMSAEAAAAFGTVMTGVGSVVAAVGAGFWAVSKEVETAWHLATQRVQVFGLKVASAMDELQGFAAQMSVAQGKADIVSMLDDIREAQATGPDLARLIESQSNIQHELREGFLPIKQILTGFFADVLRGIEQDIMPEVRAELAEIRVLMQGTLDLVRLFLTGQMLQIPDVLKGIFEQLVKARDDARKAREQKPDPHEDQYLRMLNEVIAIGVADQHRGGDVRPNIPVINDR